MVAVVHVQFELSPDGSAEVIRPLQVWFVVDAAVNHIGIKSFSQRFSNLFDLSLCDGTTYTFSTDAQRDSISWFETALASDCVIDGCTGSIHLAKPEHGECYSLDTAMDLACNKREMQRLDSLASLHWRLLCHSSL